MSWSWFQGSISKRWKNKQKLVSKKTEIMHIFKSKVKENLKFLQRNQNKDSEVDSQTYQLRRHLRKSKQVDQDSSFSLRLNTGTHSRITMLTKSNQNISSLVRIKLFFVRPTTINCLFIKQRAIIVGTCTRHSIARIWFWTTSQTPSRN